MEVLCYGPKPRRPKESDVSSQLKIRNTIMVLACGHCSLRGWLDLAIQMRRAIPSMVCSLESVSPRSFFLPIFSTAWNKQEYKYLYGYFSYNKIFRRIISLHYLSINSRLYQRNAYCVCLNHHNIKSAYPQKINIPLTRRDDL